MSCRYVETSPGAAIEEPFEDHGMHQNEFAVRMELTEKHMDKQVYGEFPLTLDAAFRLETERGVPAKF